MKSTVIVAGLLAAVATAQPHAHGHGHHHRRQQHGHHHDKRGTVVTWVTETVYETVTEIIDDSTTELIMPSTKPASTTSSSSTTLSPSPGVFFQGPETSTVAPTTTHAPAVVVPPPAPVVQSSSSSSVAPAPAPAAPSSSVAPAVIPAPAVVPAPAPASSSAAAPPAQASSGSGSGSSSGGTEYSGDLTYFTLGLGSCGFDDTGKDMTENYVAASAALMGAVSNGNPLCGRTVTITANGKTAKATIRDKCPPCSEGSLDASQALFLELFGSTDGGREKITWTLDG